MKTLMQHQLDAIRAFNYFATNFTQNFVEHAFIGQANIEHLKSKWADIYKEHGSTDALPRFYRELSRDNQDILSAFIITTYNP